MRTNLFTEARTVVCVGVPLLSRLGVAAGQMHPVSISKSSNRNAAAHANNKASGRYAPVERFTVTIMGGITTKFGESRIPINSITTPN
jgi:hypothetical protein